MTQPLRENLQNDINLEIIHDCLLPEQELVVLLPTTANLFKFPLSIAQVKLECTGVLTVCDAPQKKRRLQNSKCKNWKHSASCRELCRQLPLAQYIWSKNTQLGTQCCGSCAESSKHK